jgi:hypothetical protein
VKANGCGISAPRLARSLHENYLDVKIHSARPLPPPRRLWDCSVQLRHQRVAERIRNNRDTADGNVDRLAQHTTPCSLNLSDGFIGAGNSQFGAYCSRVVRTISVSPPGRPDRDLPDLIIAPCKPMPQCITIDAEA